MEVYEKLDKNITADVVGQYIQHERIAKEFAESEFEKYRVIQDSLYESDFDKLMNDMENNDAIH